MHLCSKDDKASLVNGLPLQPVHLHDRKVAAHVRVEHEECSRVPTHNLVPEVVDAPTSAQGAILLQIPAHSIRIEIFLLIGVVLTSNHRETHCTSSPLNPHLIGME